MLRPLLPKAPKADGSIKPTFSSNPRKQAQCEYNDTISGDISLSLYHAFYYQPLFGIEGNLPGVQSPIRFKAVFLEKWIHNLEGPSTQPVESSSLLELLTTADQVTWTMMALAAGLETQLSPDRALLVMSTALSLRYDPKCIAFDPQIETQSVHISTAERYLVLKLWVWRILDVPQGCGSCKPRYTLKSVIGRRLREDMESLSRLAELCGLKEEIFCSVKTPSKDSQFSGADPWGPLPAAVDLILTLLGLISQSGRWTVKIVQSNGYAPFKNIDWSELSESFYHEFKEQNVLFYDGSLYVSSSATTLMDFLNSIAAVGIDLEIEKIDELPSIPDYNYIKRSWNVHKWFEQASYAEYLKRVGWIPSEKALKNSTKQNLSTSC